MDSRTGKSVSAILAVLLGITVFLSPIWTQRVGIFIDDVSNYSYPNAIFQARSLQGGNLPLWEPHTFAGAYPFYTRTDACTFYPPQIVAGLISPLADPAVAYRALIIIPIVFHFLAAALGAFLLARFGLGLNRPGSSAMALAYALSVPLLGGMLNPPILYSQTWFPWIILGTTGYARHRQFRYLVLGAISLAVEASAWPIFTFHALFLSAIFAGVSAAQEAFRGRRGPALRLLLNWMGMIAIGILLSSVFWLSMLDGIRYVNATYPITFDFLTAGPRSIPPLYWATLFVPELFGNVNFSHAWGLAQVNEMWLCEGAVSRGFWLLLPGFLALASALRPRKGEHYGSRPWALVAGSLVLLAILLMMGRFTPVFRVLYRICPLFRLPYAVRWYTLYTVGLAVLTGIGVDRLTGPARGLTVTRPRLIGYSIAVLLLVSLSAAGPLIQGKFPPDFGWFMLHPVAYGALSVLILVVLVIRFHPRLAAAAVLFLALADLVYVGGRTAFLPMGVTWETEQEPVSGPGTSRLYREGQVALAEASPGFHVDFHRSHYDAVVLAAGGYSFLGVCTKPMLPRMFEILNEICSGFPYQLTVQDYGTRLPSNFSVRDWFLPGPGSPRPDWECLGGRNGSGLFHFRDPAALPRVYTLDRWKIASPIEQRRALLREDLRCLVWCDRPAKTSGIPLNPASADPDYFEGLQAENRIEVVREDGPNRLEVKLRVKKPGWLVVTDAWHPGWRAEDNGVEVPLYRVNFIQRGVWVQEGDHLITMGFAPMAWRVGRWLTLAAAGLLLLWALWRKILPGNCHEKLNSISRATLPPLRR